MYTLKCETQGMPLVVTGTLGLCLESWAHVARVDPAATLRYLRQERRTDFLVLDQPERRGVDHG